MIDIPTTPLVFQKENSIRLVLSRSLMDPSIVTTEQYSATTLSHDANSNQQPSNVAEPSETSLDDLAKGIASLLTTAFTDFDSKASDAVRSQDHLLLAIHRLTKELDQLLEDAPVPFIMQHAAKISAVRKRVSSLNSLLRSIQRRLDNIDRTLSFVGSSQDKAKMEGPTQQ